MTPTISVVVRCGDQPQRLLDTVTAALRSTHRPVDVAVVMDDTTPVRARPWVESLHGWQGVRVVASGTPAPGAVRNAGVRATTGPIVVCLDAGDRIEPDYLARAAAVFGDDDGASWFTPAADIVGPERSELATTVSVDAETLVGDPDAVHAASAFRRALWTAIDGFDETLPVLDAYDFWLRAVALGRHGRSDDAALVRFDASDATLYGRMRLDVRRADVLRLLIERHRDLFDLHVAGCLFGLERDMRRLRERHRERVARRDRAVAVLDAAPRPGTTRRFDWGDFARRSPVSLDWGYDRGGPVDRVHIESFIGARAHDIRGVVLEVQEDDYTRRFGGGRVTRSDVVDVIPANERATVVADLRRARHLPADTYDCIILTQTAHVIDDMPAVVDECARLLKPGGVLLATFPAVSRVCLEYGRDGDFWRLTEAGARRLVGRAFPERAIDTQSMGNVLTSTAFLYGLGASELPADAYATHDPYFPAVIGVRAVKPDAPPPLVSVGAPATELPRVLVYHRVGGSAVDPHRLFVSPSDFREQVLALRRECRVVPLADLAGAIRTGSLPARAVALTFDDGYADALLHASPILAELGVPATFFVTTRDWDAPFEYWWDTLARVLLGAHELPPTLTVRLGRTDLTCSTGTMDERRQAHDAIYTRLVDAPPDDRDACCRDIVVWSGLAWTDGRNRRLRSDELRELAGRPGHEIGAHTVSHPNLTTQAPDVVSRELGDARAALVDAIGRPVPAFAYPYGAHDARVRDAVAAAGYAFAVTCDERPVEAGCDPFRIPRVDVSQARSRTEIFDRLWSVPAPGANGRASSQDGLSA